MLTTVFVCAFVGFFVFFPPVEFSAGLVRNDTHGHEFLIDNQRWEGM